MPAIPALIRLLDAPENDEALDRALGEPERLDLNDDLLLHPEQHRQQIHATRSG